MDGHVSESSEDGSKILRTLFSVNCDMNEIAQVLTFFRGLDFIWDSNSCHKICLLKPLSENCFFCHMRSSCLRLCTSRGRGPKSWKTIEFICQLPQYQSQLGWNWQENFADLPTFVENTLKLLDKQESNTSELFGIPALKCQKCMKKINISYTANL